MLGRNISTGYQSRMLQVAIRQVALGVVGRYHAVLDVLRERELPEYRVVPLAEEDTAHPNLGGIDSLDDGWVFGYHFCNTSGSIAEALGKPFEVVQVRPDVLGNLDTSVP